jgi:tripartite-type tricarboxylate transporter receptor subunit TctC
MTRRFGVCVLLAIGAICLTGGSPRAEDWPAKPIRVIVGNPPAGTSDVLMRLVAPSMSQRLGQTVVVDNKPGAGGVVGTDLAAKSPPDGYTFVVTNVATFAIGATLYEKLQYDPRKDFAQVALFGTMPTVLVVNKDLPIRTLADYVAMAREKPGQVNFGSGGNGTLHHLTGTLLARAAGIDIVHVPYRGAAAAMQDVMGGQIQSMIDTLPAATPHIKGGNVRAIAVSSAKRSPAYPDLPALAESYPQVVTTNWFGLAAPAGVADRILDRMHDELVHALSLPDVRARFAEFGVEISGLGRAEVKKFVDDEIDRWSVIVRESGATPD